MLKYYCVIICVVIVNGEFLGDECTLPSGGHGQCVLFPQCQEAIRNIREGVRPHHCGFSGNDPIVCCSSENNNDASDTKSKRKCEEYKQRPPPPPGIINGLPAEAGEFPHVVALGYGKREDIRWLCGGTLISDKFIVTAAHCITSSEFGPVQWARMGTTNLEEPQKGGFPQDFEIINRLPHPNYRPPATYNDIALLELNGTIIATEYVHPACINSDVNTPRKTEAIGWGRTHFTGTASSNLMKVDLEVYSHEICNKSYSNVSKRVLSKGITDESQICAGGGRNESKDTCQGDSGGPLHVRMLEDTYIKMYNLIGVTSFGKACGIANIPGVYTRISHYISWIENIVWP